MNEIKVKLLPYNPSVVYLTSRGWQFPDGTFKPHYVQNIVQCSPKRTGLLARVFGR